MVQIEIFDELDQRLSYVPRWAILRTIQKQSVAEHCFNVERIATQIAMMWFDMDDCTIISQLALHHDDEEAIIGDIPSPSKKYVTIQGIRDEKAPWHVYSSETDKQIVKLADTMEACWFLSMEEKMGNRYVRQHRENMYDRCLSYAKQHFDHDIVEKLENWLIHTKHAESEDYDSLIGSTTSSAGQM